MPGTPAGQLSARIVYRRRGVTSDAYNENVAGFVDLGTDRAKVLWGSGDERRQAGATEARQTATFRVRSWTLSRSVQVTDRITYQGDWDITAVAPIDCLPKEIEFTGVSNRD